MLLQQLHDSGKLSARSFGVCRDAGLTTVEDVARYLEHHGTFKHLRKCGDKTEKELLSLCDEDAELLEAGPSAPPTYPFVTPAKEELFELYVQRQLHRLPVRGKNALTALLDADFSAKNLYARVLGTEPDFKSLQNVGVGTVGELRRFREHALVRFQEILATDDERELTARHLTDFLGEGYGIPEAELVPITEVARRTGRIPFFYLTELVVLSPYFFDHPVQRDLFRYGFRFYQDQPTGLDNNQIADRHGLSRERVRQLKVTFQETLGQRLGPLVDEYRATLLNQYGVDERADFFYFDAEQVAIFNEAEGIGFTSHFYACFFASVLAETHTAIGGTATIRRTPANHVTDRAWRGSYVVRRDLLGLVRLKDLMVDLYRQVTEIRRQTYALPVTEYLRSYYTGTTQVDFLRVVPLGEHLMEAEFDRRVKLDGTIVFERTRRRYVWEYVAEVLENAGRLMKVEEIFAEVEASYPGVVSNAQSVRAAMNHEPEVFIYIGRSSTYGLKTWENETDTKGGTIRELAAAYLADFNEPRHVFDVTEHIKKYRDTNEKNVIANLRLDRSEQFVFYSGNFVGLHAKMHRYGNPQFRILNGSQQTRRRLSRFNGYHLEQVILMLAAKYRVQPVQIRSMLMNRVAEDEARIDPDTEAIYFS